MWVQGKRLRVRRVRISSLGRTWHTTRSRDGRIALDRTLHPGGFMQLSVLVHEMVHHLRWDLTEPRTLHLEYAIVGMVLSNPALFQSLSKHAPPRARRR